MVSTDIAFNHRWLASHGWQCGLWADTLEFDEEQIARIIDASRITGEDRLFMANPYGPDGASVFVIPAGDAKAIRDTVFLEFCVTTHCIVPERQSFAITHRCDQIVCYAAPPDLLPALSLQGSAAAEKAHLDRFVEDWYGGMDRCYVPEILAANDGFWWWQ